MPLQQRPRFLLIAGVLSIACTVTTRAQSGADARQRAMYVTVTDQGGAPVAGLTADDFVVREDGVQREVLRVETATAPIEITLLVDTSQSAAPFIADMRRALGEFVKQMAPGNEIALTTFAARPRIVQNYTGNLALLERAVGRLFAEQGTGAYLLEALSSAAAGVAKRAPERAAIIAIVAQPGPEFSNLPYAAVVKALRDCGAAFDAITAQEGSAVTPPLQSEQAATMRDRDRTLDEATRATGGVNEQALSSLALLPQMRSIAAQLRGQYRLVYSRPESLIPPEKIQVSVKKPGLTARGTPVRQKQ